MSSYNISKSSLLSLKAEILRKQQELIKGKSDNDVKLKNLKKTVPLELKKLKPCSNTRESSLNEEETELLAKSKSVLEAKTQLYDKFSQQTIEQLTEEEQEYNSRLLVRFADKEKYQPSNPDEEWVEYIDCLGRTRTCLRKDLSHIKQNDQELKITVEARRQYADSNKQESPEKTGNSEITEENSYNEESELLSGDMRRELLRRKWEQEENELKNKKDVHYQDMLFDEARTHGVGYYAFSKDEEERAKQQAALRKLREETRMSQKKADEIKKTRERILATRIAAAENRKRARLGLPPLEINVDEVTKVQKNDSDTSANSDAEEENVKAIDVSRKEAEERRQQHVRPWDIGKMGVKEHYEYSQEEWVERKRNERSSDFAPPSVYHNVGEKPSRSFRFERDFGSEEKAEILFDKNEGLTFSSKKMRNNTLRSQISEVPTTLAHHRGAEVEPPSTYNVPTNAARARHSTDNAIDESIATGLKYLRDQIEKRENTKRPKLSAKYDMFE